MTFIVAIDGPAGTGKSSVAKTIAKKLDFVYVDTGAIYRALAYVCEQSKVDAANEDHVLALVPKITMVVDHAHHCSKIEVDGRILDSELREEHISRLSSVVSQHPKVRSALLDLQRNLRLGVEKGAIFEGRDIGTVVFPHADIKFFISANSETRALRRFHELMGFDQSITFEAVHEAIKKRDERDKNRQNAPMQKALDAITIDTSAMTLDEVVAHTLGLINTKLSEGKG